MLSAVVYGVGRHEFASGIDLEDAIDEVALSAGEVVTVLLGDGEIDFAVFVEDVAAIFVDFVAVELFEGGVLEVFLEGFLVGEDGAAEEVGDE